MDRNEEMLKRIENSTFFKRYGLKSYWLSGSSTYIAPITNWIPSKEINIKIDPLVSHNGMTNSFKKLYNELAKDFPVKSWYYAKNDGSCPQEYIIHYE